MIEQQVTGGNVGKRNPLTNHPNPLLRHDLKFTIIMVILLLTCLTGIALAILNGLGLLSLPTTTTWYGILTVIGCGSLIILIIE